MVQAKKHLGQHFLINEGVKKKIIEVVYHIPKNFTIEIGAGTGVLTKELIQCLNKNEFLAIDIDKESIEYLKRNFPENADQFLLEDFLNSERVDAILSSKLINIVGNFPYNISSQIMFKVLNYKNNIQYVVGMFQKEVAKRICAAPHNKDYGILSVLLQTYFETEYLFTVNEGSFNPPPKVKSAVVLLKNKMKKEYGFNEHVFFDVVKTAFNQRRKTLRNSLKKFGGEIEFLYKDKRPEQLSYYQFIEITNQIEKQMDGKIFKN
ncbi:MAG: 16S rRNA (adenine(1518)-N(6)/adenine(1519)-N(6))-dimethyltransferase RsmA [Bacteroidia bacterium]|nr:16S rRNA (adenine(1518)-N(6)/adenine(1519)-N(6))-dimethyltransferase RsmA [Bacteroidia bacterium]